MRYFLAPDRKKLIMSKEPKCEHGLDQNPPDPCTTGLPPLGWTIQAKKPRCAVHRAEAGEQPSWKPTD